jgi:AraC-like DNA-binding protein
MNKHERSGDFQDSLLAVSDGVDWRRLAARSEYRPVRLAQLCRVSLRQLERRVKAARGITPRLWLKRERLRDALAFLQKAETSKEVAHGLGYRQFSQFCREFRDSFGLTPTEFRRSPKAEQDRLLGLARQVAEFPGPAE